MPQEIAFRGEVRTAMTVFWFTQVLKKYPNHLVAYGANIDRFIPATLRGKVDLQRRAIVVRKLQMIPIEAIVRGHLTGSGWASYQKAGPVCGITLPPGLHDGSNLPAPIFHPATRPAE